MFVSIVIDNSHLPRSIIRPPEDETPLVVDSDGMKACAVALEWFQAIAERYGEVPERVRLIQSVYCFSLPRLTLYMALVMMSLHGHIAMMIGLRR